ncbi:hypothetical protein PMIN06_001297 [Paraphaeosphaeria minitans]
MNYHYGVSHELTFVRPRAADGLNTRAVVAGKQYFGSATDNGELTNSAYVAGLSNTVDFGQSRLLEPSRGTFNYVNGDVIANFAANNGQYLRCHTLVWYNQLPSWITNGGFNNATLISILNNHITNKVTHYKGKCLQWDVVNEALNEDGTYRINVFYNTIGPAYIPIAFAAAATADPSAKFYYNDYNIEAAGAKSTAAQNIVKLVKSYGAKIDGIGMQAHLIVGSSGSESVSAWTANMNAFTALDVDVAITELDIRSNTPATAAAVTQQAKDYVTVIQGCKAVARCIGITIWDYTDKCSWIPGVFSGQGAALPWDENLNKKVEVFNAMLSAWGTGYVKPLSHIGEAAVDEDQHRHDPNLYSNRHRARDVDNDTGSASDELGCEQRHGAEVGTVWRNWVDWTDAVCYRNYVYEGERLLQPMLVRNKQLNRY